MSKPPLHIAITYQPKTPSVTDTPNRPPLWEAMRDASLLDPFATSKESYAAEIRALRDWLLPEESIQGEPGRFVNGCCLKTCQSIRALLTAEADRAEHS